MKLIRNDREITIKNPYSKNHMLPKRRRIGEKSISAAC